jgi:hypothetical protein
MAAATGFIDGRIGVATGATLFAAVLMTAGFDVTTGAAVGA